MPHTVWHKQESSHCTWIESGAYWRWWPWIFGTSRPESTNFSVIEYVQFRLHSCQLILQFFLFHCCLLWWICLCFIRGESKISMTWSLQHVGTLTYTLTFPLHAKGPNIYLILLILVPEPPYRSDFTGSESLSVRIPSSVTSAPNVSQLQIESEFKASAHVPSMEHWQPVSEESLEPLQYVFTTSSRFIQDAYLVRGFTVQVCLIDWLQLVEISAKAWI